MGECNSPQPMNEKARYNPQIHHRRSIRLKGYDYSQAGLYFITICCHNRKHIFGQIAFPQASVGANCIRPISLSQEDHIPPEMILNQFGQIAYNEWIKTPEIRPNVELGEFIIMPNHFHAIIRLLDDCKGELHSPIIPNKSDLPENTITKKGECNSPPQSPSQTIGAIVRGYKSSVTKQLGLLGFNGTLWQRNYYEHIIRDEKSYKNISDYIINNPAKWADDTFNTIKNDKINP